MKKLVSLLLALVMVLSASAMAFANYVDYDAKDAIISVEDADGKNILRKISAEYLKDSDSIVRAIKKAKSAEAFVESIDMDGEIDGMISNYKISSELFEFSTDSKLDYPIELTFSVSGVKADDTVVLLVKNGNSWEAIEGVAGRNKVTASFDKLGKVVILVGDASGVTPSSNFFVDVLSTDWFYDAVKYCTDKGYLKGVDATHFGPGITLTRAMVAVTIYRVEGSPEHAIDYPFLDCPSDWYKEGIAWAYDNGVITGYSDKAFGPDDPVTREQLVAMFGRYHQLKGNTLPEGSVDIFSDASSISRYAVPFVKWAVGKGLLNGRGINGKVLLAPTGKATRAEFAQVLYNYMK